MPIPIPTNLRTLLKACGRQGRKDVAAADDAVAAHVQQSEGDAQAFLRRGGDLLRFAFRTGKRTV